MELSVGMHNFLERSILAVASLGPGLLLFINIKYLEFFNICIKFRFSMYHSLICEPTLIN